MTRAEATDECRHSFSSSPLWKVNAWYRTSATPSWAITSLNPKISYSYIPMTNHFVHSPIKRLLQEVLLRKSPISTFLYKESFNWYCFQSQGMLALFSLHAFFMATFWAGPDGPALAFKAAAPYKQISQLWFPQYQPCCASVLCWLWPLSGSATLHQLPSCHHLARWLILCV